MQPIICADTLLPVAMTTVGKNIYVYDMGNNFAGVCLLNVKGERGTSVTMRFSEMIDSTGVIDQRNMSMHLRPAMATDEIQKDVYILKGEGYEEFSPLFTYHGYQYVQVETDRPLKLTKESVKGIIMHSGVESIGHFSCSNELINKIWGAANNSYLSNLFGIPTDCPHREKNGWAADGHIVMESGLLNYNSALVYEKWVNDMIDAQEDDGNIPGIIPTSWSWDSNWAGPIWDAVIFIVPVTLYEYTGNVEPMKKIYQSCKRYLDYLETREVDGLIDHGLGDWLFYKAQTSVGLMTSCYYYQDNIQMAKMAKLTGNGDDAIRYLRKAEELKNLINKKYLNWKTLSYEGETQLSYALPLYMGIVPEDIKLKVAENLKKKIVENDYSLDFGFIGSKIVPIVLSDYGYDEAIYKMVTKETLPSWGYWINRFGSTSLFEAWDHTRSIGDASLNHPSMGSINAWMFKSLAGIRPDPLIPDFRHILIKPSFIKDLDWVRATYDSSQGLISSEWKRDENGIILKVSIPANTKATVYTGFTKSEVLEGGKSVKAKKNDDETVGYEIESGSYSFLIHE